MALLFINTLHLLLLYTSYINRCKNNNVDNPDALKRSGLRPKRRSCLSIQPQNGINLSLI